MIETKTATINGREWQCTQWSGTKNLRMFHRLATILMPALAAGVSKPNAVELLTAQIDAPTVVSKLMDGFGSSSEFESLVKTMLEGVHIDGRHITQAEFDVAFVGKRLFDLIPGLRFVIETNFGDFSTLVADIMSRNGGQRAVPVSNDSTPS